MLLAEKIKNNSVIFKDLGLINYKQAWDLQEKTFAGTVDVKMYNRNALPEEQKPTPNHLFFCEHPHVYTLGKSGTEENLLLKQQELNEKEAAFYKINRGGDITYHGPGQIVGYPILDLDNFFTDIHKYLRLLEESIIKTLNHFELEGKRYPGYTGVWLEPENPLKARKICAMGVRCSRWVTMHGFAFNVNPDLSYFNNIIPCGITDKKVTSMEMELGRKVSVEEVKAVLKKYLSEIFEMKLVE
jgi:lipoyl(octanoyl) transferase